MLQHVQARALAIKLLVGQPTSVTRCLDAIPPEALTNRTVSPARPGNACCCCI